MVEKIRPKVILLEDNDAISQRASTILAEQGWDVTCEQVSENALATLKESKEGPFALFISNFKLPQMEGDDILQHVKNISPLTQRMLMISSEKTDILINAINKAGINACITAPFKEEDLIEQTWNCFRQFKREIKRRRLKRVTGYQNKQMFKVAQKLKKKDSTFEKKVEDKKNTLLRLKSRLRAAEAKKKLNRDITLSSFVDQQNIKPAPETLRTEFTELCKNIHSVFHSFCTQKNFPVIPLDMDRIFSPHSPSDSPAQGDDTEASEQEDPSVTEEQDGETNGEPATDEPPGKIFDQIDPDVLDKIIKYTLVNAMDLPEDEPFPVRPSVEPSAEASGEPLDELIDLRISENQTKAFVKLKNPPEPDAVPTVSDVLNWLSGKMISYGIIDDEGIEAWLGNPALNEIIIAEGEAPVFGSPGVITYHFEIDFTNPGKINEDGSIDFRDRGEIPYVQAGVLLAEKEPARQGEPGTTISGIPIPVDEMPDPVFAAGTGVAISENGLTIHSEIGGQPHVDAMGLVSVSPELVINGDVDFETGNVDFNGNIIVRGMVKEGFTVKGISLTAQEIEGADIHLSGDLNVSAGINNTRVSVQGNVYAKFLNNSEVTAFGDLSISKEIIDSTILLSGACRNETGHIISSKITAKLGVEAGNIGTSSSKPSLLVVGVDEHIQSLLSDVEERLETSVNKTGLLKDDIKSLEDEDQSLYAKISEKAHVQDRSQLEINQLKKSLPKFEKSNDTAQLNRVNNRIKEFNEKAKQAENQLNAIFETQDDIAHRIEKIRAQLAVIQDTNKQYVLEKRALKEFSDKDSPKALINVKKTILQATVIKGPHASIIVRDDRSRCKIQEVEKKDELVQFFEIAFSDLL